MELLRQFLESFADVLLLWTVSGVGLGGMLLKFLKLRKCRRPWVWARLVASERGSYSVSLLMTLPTFVALLAMFVQCTCLILIKIGTVYAAFAAARSVVVWGATDAPSEVVASQMQSAAAKALAPFASGISAYAETSSPACPSGLAEAVAQAYESVSRAGVTLEKNAEKPKEPIAGLDLVEQKVRNAHQSTSIRLLNNNGQAYDINDDGRTDAEDVKRFIANRPSQVAVELTYRAPLVVPGFARLLSDKDDAGNSEAADGPSGSFHQRSVVTTVDIVCDWPIVNPSKTPRIQCLGVRYDEIH